MASWLYKEVVEHERRACLAGEISAKALRQRVLGPLAAVGLEWIQGPEKVRKGLRGHGETSDSDSE